MRGRKRDRRRFEVIDIMIKNLNIIPVEPTS